MTETRTYLDYNATCPLRPAAAAIVRDVAGPTGNPSSVHAEGRRARSAIETARDQVAAVAGVPSENVIFTSGATEAANLALAPELHIDGRREKVGKIYTAATEHPCVLSGGRLGVDHVTAIDVDGHGIIDLAHLDDVLSRHDRNTGLAIVAVMAANNETGVIQPIEHVAAIAATHGALVFCDAVQAAGRIDLAPISAVSDFLILSGHKLGGIAGAGALILRSAGIAPVAAMTGGRQERGHRAGTEPLLAIATFGAAAIEAAASTGEPVRLGALRDNLERGLMEITPSALIAGRDMPRIPNTTTVMLPGANAETLVIALDLAGVSVSAGSACSSGKVTPSHVLGAMGVGAELARAAIRISTGWATTQADIETFLAAWRHVTARLRATEAAA